MLQVEVEVGGEAPTTTLPFPSTLASQYLDTTWALTC